MGEKRISPLFRVIKWLIWLFYPKIQIEEIQNVPDGAAMIVANHTKMNGPICSEIHFPGDNYTWCASEMMHLKEVPAYAYKDFWSGKPRCIRWLYKGLSYIIAPLAVLLFNNAKTIPVYRDARVLSTFRETLKRLAQDKRVVVFPEYAEAHNHILCKFQEGFVDIGRMYYKRTGKELAFVPMYIAPRLKKMYIGKPIYSCHTNPIDQERKRICEYLMHEITEIACALPRHKVVPYLNLPRHMHTYNKPEEVNHHEKTGG